MLTVFAKLFDVFEVRLRFPWPKKIQTQEKNGFLGGLLKGTTVVGKPK